MLALVVGGLGTVAIADVGTTSASTIEGDAQAHNDTRTYGYTDGHAYSDDSNQSEHDDGLRLTDYDIENRTIAPDDPLDLVVRYEGDPNDSAAGDLVLTVDSDPHRLGTVTASEAGDRVDFEPDPDSRAEGIDVDCEAGINEDDELYVKCTISVEWPWSDDDGANDGSNDVDVGVGDLDATTVTIEDDDNDDESLHLVDYDINEEQIDEDEPLRMTTRLEGSGNTSLSISADGRRHDVAHLRVSEAADEVDVEQTEVEAWPDIEVDCEIDTSGIECEIIISAAANLAPGDHDVGLGEQDPTTVTVQDTDTDDGLDLVDYGIQERTIDQGEPLDLTATYEGENTENTSEPLQVRIDGERHRLGTMTASPETERIDFEPNPDSQAESVDVDCEVGHNQEDGYYLRCEISIEWPWSDDEGANDGSRDVDVGVGDLDATTVTVGNDTDDDGLALVDYDLREQRLSQDDPIELTATYDPPEQESAATELVVSIDDQRRRLGTLTAGPEGERVDVDPDDPAAADSVDIDCDVDFEEPVIECTITIEWPWGTDDEDGGSSHEVGVGSMEQTTLTVLSDGSEDSSDRNDTEQQDGEDSREQRNDDESQGQQGSGESVDEASDDDSSEDTPIDDELGTGPVLAVTGLLTALAVGATVSRRVQ